MNSIIKRGRIFFISLLALVVISVTLMTTFAFQTMNVSIKKGTDELKVKAGILDVDYTSIERINMKNVALVKSYKLGDYTEFKVGNTKSTESVVYKIKLVNLEYSESLKTSNFKYTLFINNELVSEGDFSSLNSNEFTIKTDLNDYNYIEVGNTDNVRLYLWLESTDNNQNYLKNSFFKGNIEIESIFAKDSLIKFFTKFNIYGDLGTIIEDKSDSNYGKYLINVNDEEIILNEPLRCVEDVCDYIDLIGKKVIRKVMIDTKDNNSKKLMDSSKIEKIDGINLLDYIDKEIIITDGVKEADNIEIEYNK